MSVIANMMNTECIFAMLTHDLYRIILSYLPARSILFMAQVNKYLNNRYKGLLDHYKAKIIEYDAIEEIIFKSSPDIRFFTCTSFLSNRNPIWPYLFMRDHKKVLSHKILLMFFISDRHDPRENLIPKKSPEYIAKNIRNISIGHAITDIILGCDLVDIFQRECQIIHQEGFIPYIRIFGNDYYFGAIIGRSLCSGFDDWTKIAEYLYRLYLSFDLDPIWTEFFRLVESMDGSLSKLPTAFSMIPTNKLDKIDQFHQYTAFWIFMGLIKDKPLKVLPPISSQISDRDRYMEIIRKYQGKILFHLYVEEIFD